jgi:hypothetical protein
MSRAATPPVPHPQDQCAEHSYRCESDHDKHGEPMVHVLCDQKRPQKDIDRDAANREEDNQKNIDWKSLLD